jgi:hypothetical protein
MNKLYPALIVSILCSMSSIPLLISYHREENGAKWKGLEFVLLYPIWIVAGTMLAAIALAPQGGVGATLFGAVFVLSLAAYVIYRRRSVIYERNLRRRARRMRRE